MTAWRRRPGELEYRVLMRRLGTVLIVLGVLDILDMVKALVNGESYSSSVNIFAVIAGVMLVRGSLRTARYVRFYGGFLVSAIVTAIGAIPFVMPMGLIVAEVRHAGAGIVVSFLVAVAFLAIIGVVVWALGDVTIQVAMIDAGMRPTNLRGTLATGVGAGLLMMILLAVQKHDGRDQHAISLAKREGGSRYHYYVTGLTSNGSRSATKVNATVSAWNDKELLTCPATIKTSGRRQLEFPVGRAV